MMVYKLQRVQELPVSPETAWSFFSDPRNLARITPPEMRFTILTPRLPAEIHAGLRIRYRVSPLRGLRLTWETGIREVSPPFRFTDTQLRGPYALWEHTHRFEACSEGTRMTDDLVYTLPFGVVGELAHAWFIRKKLDDIFAFRAHVVGILFQNHNAKILTP